MTREYRVVWKLGPDPDNITGHSIVLDSLEQAKSYCWQMSVSEDNIQTREAGEWEDLRRPASWHLEEEKR